ncbi:hypothetical protein O3M35_000466 [Rhynocoris fuscipes]|uniref:RNA exonuclease 4 n=1 Tax=Rhynocoris fuscipes TaxID=488301 RepID=A0AAW1DST9_9HEMI
MKNNALTRLNTDGSTGSNNWEKFLLQQGKEFVIGNNAEGYNSKVKPIHSNLNKNNKLTKVIGIDCEMVGVGEDGKDNLLARVSIVNLFGDCLYDKFVKPKETVTDYRTHISGVRAADLKNADDFETVQKEVADLIKGRIIVGHAIKNDLEVLFLSHPRHQIRDTAKFFRKKGCGTPSLKNLASEYLGVKIQSGEHSSIQDAQAAVQLYNMFRKQWETGGGNKKNNRIDTLQK